MPYEECTPSIGQRLLWFLDRYRGDNGALNCPTLCRMRGRLDVTALRAALDEVARRHESLRTVFAGGGRRLVQRIHEPGPVALEEVDLSGAADPGEALERAVAEELRTRIDPSAWPVRCTLWRVAGDDHVLCVNMHHMVTDSWSCGIVFEDLCVALERAGGAGAGFAEPGWQYRDFVAWQEQALAGGELPAVPLRTPAAGGSSRNTARRRAVLGPGTAAGLRRLAAEERTTVFAVLLAVYYVQLWRLTGQDDLAVASLFANRARREVRRTVGFLANMVVLRTRVPPGATFLDVVRAAHATVVDGFLHQALPYQLLPLESVRQGDQRADDVVFQMLADPLYTTTSGGVGMEVLLPDGVGTRFLLELVLVPQGGGMQVLLFHDADRVAEDVAVSLIDGFAAAARAVATRPAVALADL